jgi:thiamine-phosphate pyrophosphorylase
VTPVLCLITDRRRYGADWPVRLVGQVRAAARAGVHLVQVRERDLDGGPLCQLVAACVDAVRGTSARVLVNDRLDVALAARAHGVHLRGDSMPASRVRQITPPGFVVGRSVHAPGELADRVEHEAVDYVLFGTVFETASKPGRAAAGLPLLATMAAASRRPVLAVGGITVDRVGMVMNAGAAGVAAIGLFADTPAEHLGELVRTLAPEV